jgi:hypothetical protein
MVQRIVAIVLIALLAALHAQLWLGRGSVPAVKLLQRQIAAQKAANVRSAQLNERLASEAWCAPTKSSCRSRTECNVRLLFTRGRFLATL